ncbi:MAG: hypothetical protein ACK55I_41910, partial [bacterium]
PPALEGAPFEDRRPSVAVHHVVDVLEDVAEHDAFWPRPADEVQLDHVLPEVRHELLGEVGEAHAAMVGAGDAHRLRGERQVAGTAPFLDRRQEVDDEVGAEGTAKPTFDVGGDVAD